MLEINIKKKKEINIKRYLKIAHIFSSVMWNLLRDVFNLAIKSLNNVRLKKKNTHRGGLQRRKRLNEKLTLVCFNGYLE